MEPTVQAQADRSTPAKAYHDHHLFLMCSHHRLCIKKLLGKKTSGYCPALLMASLYVLHCKSFTAVRSVVSTWNVGMFTVTRLFSQFRINCEIAARGAKFNLVSLCVSARGSLKSADSQASDSDHDVGQTP